LADVLTKLLPQATKDRLCDKFMYWKAKVHRYCKWHIGYLLGMLYHVAKQIQVMERSVLQWLLCILFEGTE
jgi:hypothetical protein